MEKCRKPYADQIWGHIYLTGPNPHAQIWSKISDFRMYACHTSIDWKFDADHDSGMEKVIKLPMGQYLSHFYV